MNGFGRMVNIVVWMLFQIVVEAIKGQSEQSAVAVDDVRVSRYPCTSPGHCTFEMNMCSWRNLMAEDDTDWLRNQGNSRSPSTGPSVDHTTNSSIGQFFKTRSIRPTLHVCNYSDDVTTYCSCFCRLLFVCRLYSGELGTPSTAAE